MTSLYRLAKLICLGIIAYSLWRISQKDFVAKVTSDSPKSDATAKAMQDLNGTLNEVSLLRRTRRIGVEDENS